MTIGSSMSFDPAHARLRKKAANKLKQSTAEQLELETKRMEERIRALKEQMVKEKEEREKFGGTRWMSSNKGGPVSHNPQQATKKKTSKSEKGPRKIKLLSDEPLIAHEKIHEYRYESNKESYSQENDNATYTKKSIIKESLRGSFGSDMQCGQCEKAKATLACVECTENYCVGCFMSFHRKGALRNHQTKNLDQVSNGLPEEKGRINESPPRRIREPDSRKAHAGCQNGGSPEQKTGGLLFQGTYDEKESAASFQEALRAWREAGKNKENSWVNPADDIKVSSVSCETNTVPDSFKLAEINLNFGTNKSMSYLDRLVLKKHREGGPIQPASRSKSRGEHKRSTSKDNKPSGEQSTDDFGINYREIFQNIGVHSARQRSSSSQNYYGRASFAIEEVLDNVTNTEETTSCIVEEQTGDSQNAAATQVKEASRSGRVSILGMTADGDFREDTDDIVPPTANSAPSRSSLHSSLGGSHLSRLIAQRGASSAGAPRIWSPKPTYTGLSDFFLAGVKSPSPSTSPKRENLESSAKRASSKLFTKGVWKPGESVCIIDVTVEETEEKESTGVANIPVIPLVQEPSYDVDSDHGKENRNQMEKGNSIEEEVQNMQDFGIVDFLKAGPVPRKLSGDYYDVHRVSTVSPLTLTPNPPQLHWSDDDSDDDAIVDVATQAACEERISRCEVRKEQEDEDRVTLEDLTWELASTTGRLTQCEGNLEDCHEEEHVEKENCVEQEDVNSCDEDSIEENNGGTSLGDDSSDEDEIQLEDSLSIEEVHALK